MTGVAVRCWRPAEAGALARIFHCSVQQGTVADYNQAQRDGWSAAEMDAQTYRNRLDGLETFVAEADGAPVGFLTFDPSDHIDLLFVAPDWIGKGVAFALYRHALDAARARGLSRLTVEASAMSERFFARQGWHRTGSQARGEGPERIVNALMAIDL